MKAFDYVVVGSGSAGAIVASRLSEDGEVSVLLLEAGRRDNHPFMGMPVAFPKVAATRSFIWPFETEPEPGLNDRKLDIWRGKTLGGCSSINAMINVRGSRHDYDMLAEQGLAGWAYRDVLPYFKKLEASWRGPGPYHGTDGPIPNVPAELGHSHYAELEEAAAALGLPSREDHNGEEQEGISRVELTTIGGRRASSARAYLTPAVRSRKNLTILTNAEAMRVLLEGTRAVGVEYSRSGNIERVQADREVILSAGTYKSPQLLMLSGIGPADHLKAFNIPVVHDLKGVGENLQEHPNLLNIYRTHGKIGLSHYLRLDRATLAVMRWALTGKGPFASAGTMANIFVRSQPGARRPDIQIIAMPVHQHAELWLPGITKPPVFAYTARVGILHARFRGWVRLNSANPFDNPRIRFNMFTDRADMASMIKAVRLSRELFAQSSMQDVIAEELLPGPDYQSDEELAEAIRAQAEHRHHAVGTCRMGTDDNAVLDAQLRVRGIDNLRVADASVFPDDPSGNTNVPTMMVGEKAADLVKGRTLEPEDI